MRFSSLDQLGIDPLKLAAMAALLSLFAGVVTFTAVSGSLGAASEGVSVAVSATVFYIVMSAPRRAVDHQRLTQSSEAPLISASASACLAVTGSRSRTVMLLRPRDPVIRMMLTDTCRRVLLGGRAGPALEKAAESLVSYSAAAALRGLASFSSKGIEQGDEETRGLSASAGLAIETKIPMLMTVCFFSPILIVVYSVFSHSFGLSNLAGLVALEFIVLDLAFYLGSGDRSIA